MITMRDKAMVNFDVSMQYFDSLDETEFNAALKTVLKTSRTFKPVQNLHDWDEVEGVYIMVFDDLKQFYIGQSNDVRKRIRGHWTGRKHMDRIVFGTPYESIFPVDELKALDTTRIYAARGKTPFSLESTAEAAADRRFSLNRKSGGEGHGLLFRLEGVRQRGHKVIAKRSSRATVEEATSGVMDLIRRESGAGIVDKLAALDLKVHSYERADGRTGLWSVRDGSRRAAIRGELSVGDYQGYLEAIGEAVIWPPD